MSSASAAPRYPTAASPNAVPDPIPSSAAREVQPPAIARSERLSFGNETRITPAVATTMAATEKTVIRSPSRTRPSTAICSSSVFA